MQYVNNMKVSLAAQAFVVKAALFLQLHGSKKCSAGPERLTDVVSSRLVIACYLSTLMVTHR